MRLFRVEDGPPQGCIAVDGPQGPEAWDAALDVSRPRSAALDRTLTGTEVDRALAGVHVLPLSDLPAEVASWVRQARPVAQR